jgi:hypothetical protein
MLFQHLLTVVRYTQPERSGYAAELKCPDGIFTGTQTWDHKRIFDHFSKSPTYTEE